ncbi:uncharacterized protein OGAPODRAFT_95802 [Ogataea polymorpha]|uniref:uncharacterized protein n=1 Tax=Ogataea polymorpha TaxID=460523 RepID=UPI0007F3B0A3|nr:uncharacterized protein OGAPODRAFT_95802 [Ogataea polymorpha]OBA13648.1 hypothetical protein OGAPODRAFT_95802 [Ogataea polymorpha]
MSSLSPQLQKNWSARIFVVHLPGDPGLGNASVRLVLGHRSSVDLVLSHLDPQPGPSNVRDPIIVWPKFGLPPNTGVLVNGYYAFGDIYQLDRNSEPPLADVYGKSVDLRPPTRIGYLRENKVLTDRNAVRVALSPKQNVAVKKQYHMTRKEIGSLIGKKGKDIERIREQTTAKIKIHDTADTENVAVGPGMNQMQLLEIIGLQEEVKQAEQLIQKKISQWRATKS